MKWDFKIVVLLVEWSSFRGGLKAGLYCISTYIVCVYISILYALYFERCMTHIGRYFF